MNRQARQWLSEVANQRQHRETRQRPTDRFQPAVLKPLPVIPYDYRDSVELLFTKIFVCSSMAIATACPNVMWAAA